MVGANTLELYGCRSILNFFYMILKSLKQNKNEQARKMYLMLSEDQQNSFEKYFKKAAKPDDLKLSLDATLEMLGDINA